MPTLKLGPFGTYRITKVQHGFEQSFSSTSEADPSKVNFKQRAYLPPYYDSTVPQTTIIDDGTIVAEQKLPFAYVRQGPSESRPARSEAEQLRRYILEIIAMTMDANFDLLNIELHGSSGPEPTTSLLSDEERQKLQELSAIVRRASRQALPGGRNIKQTDKDTIFDEIAKQTPHLFNYSGTNYFVLDLIGWYGEVAHHPVPWRATIPAHWAAKDEVCRLPGFEPYLHGSMIAFKAMIKAVASNDGVRKVLNDAFEDCRIRADVPLYQLLSTLSGRSDLGTII